MIKSLSSVGFEMSRMFEHISSHTNNTHHLHDRFEARFLNVLLVVSKGVVVPTLLQIGVGEHILQRPVISRHFLLFECVCGVSESE